MNEMELTKRDEFWVLLYVRICGICEYGKKMRERERERGRCVGFFILKNTKNVLHLSIKLLFF